MLEASCIAGFSVTLLLQFSYYILTVGRQLIFEYFVFLLYIDHTGIMVKTPPYQKRGKCGHFMRQFDSHLACFGCRAKCKWQDPLFYGIDVVNENENLFPKKMCSKCYITMKHAKVKSESPKIDTSVFKGKKEMTKSQKYSNLIEELAVRPIKFIMNRKILEEKQLQRLTVKNKILY